jgi:ABC-2 type transport system ATP-binding protein
MKRFGLWKYRNYHWNELSSGYKMRFELARTFLRKPKLLLIDEPLSNLDIVSQKLIVEDLMMLSKSPTNPLGIVLSSQQLYELEKISTDVIFLKNGVPTQSGNTKIEEGSVVVELEIQQDQATLEASLKGMNVKGITFNGGTYLIHVNDCHVSQLLQAFADAKLDVTYFRNVTNSTRRFF